MGLTSPERQTQLLAEGENQAPSPHIDEPATDEVANSGRVLLSNRQVTAERKASHILALIKNGELRARVGKAMCPLCSSHIPKEMSLQTTDRTTCSDLQSPISVQGVAGERTKCAIGVPCPEPRVPA